MHDIKAETENRMDIAERGFVIEKEGGIEGLWESGDITRVWGI